MPILFQCPRCDASIQVADDAAGKKGHCPQCQARLKVPEAAPPPLLIEFECPRCRAGIRVPEKAVGQKGRCPQCQAKVLVPNPNAPTAPTTASPPSDAELPTAFPHLDPAMYSLPMETGSVAPTRVTRRRRSGSWRGMIPIILMAGLIGYLGWLYWRPDESMTGTMTVERLASFQFPDIPVEESVTGLSRTKYRQLARDLEGDPLGLNTTLNRVMLSSRKERLYLTIGDGVEASIYRVDLRKRPGLLKWVADHHADLNGPREAAVDRDMPKFMAGALAARDDGGLETIIGYRDTALFGYLTSGFGFHVVAVASGQAYRCIFEDSDGRLYFLLPGETRSFELRGRPVDDAKPVFTGRITCQVARPNPKRKVTDPAEPEEPSKGDESPDSEAAKESAGTGEMADGDTADAEMIGDEETPSKGDSEAMPADDSEEMSPGMKPAGMKSAGKTPGAKKPAMMKEPSMDGEPDGEGAMKAGDMKPETEMTEGEMPAPAKKKKAKTSSD